jgi:hypothetical protein
MAYIKIIKENVSDELGAYEKIKEAIDNKIRIHKKDIHYAIRKSNEKIISVLLDNIPLTERFPSLYGAIVRGNRPKSMIHLLFDKKVRLDDNILIFCIDENKLDYIDYFVEKDPRIISVFVLMEALENYDLIKYFARKIKEHQLYIDNYELVISESYNMFCMFRNPAYLVLETLQDYNIKKVIFYDEIKEDSLWQNKGFDIIKQNTEIKTRHIKRVIESNSVEFLIDILPKYDRKISQSIMSQTNNTVMIDLMIKHNEKYFNKILKMSSTEQINK